MHNGYHSNSELLPFSETIIWTDAFFFEQFLLSHWFMVLTLCQNHTKFLFSQDLSFSTLSTVRSAEIRDLVNLLWTSVTMAPLSLKKRNKQTKKQTKPRISNRNKTSFCYWLFGKGSTAISKLWAWEQVDAFGVSVTPCRIVRAWRIREERRKLRKIVCTTGTLGT